MELAVGSRGLRGCWQQILADLPGMSMPTGESFLPRASVPIADAAKSAAGVAARPAGPATLARPRELGGREGPEPTRFGDWEKHGRCIDF